MSKTVRGRLYGGALHGRVLALLGALTLLPTLTLALLDAPHAQAAPQTHYYGVLDTTPTATATSPATATTTATAAATATATVTPGVTATATATATATSTPTPAPTATPSGPPPNALDVSAAASAAGWPQQNGNWCGIATVALIADYVNPGSPISQGWVYSALNNPANVSMWGTPPPPTSATWGVTTWGPYLNADIAQDFGTDPRSLAEGLTVATGQNYHVVVDTNGAYDMTIHLVDDLLLSRQPISVFVDHGEHSIIVSGVDATGDPLTNPGSITALHVWDPGGGVVDVGIQPQMAMTVSMSDWLNGVIPWSGSDYLKYPYAANLYGGLPLDPDPSVGPYTYAPAKYNHLWIGHYVYISPRAPGAAAGLSPDWELNQNGAVLAGFASAQYAALPAGYSGPSVLMPTNPPPPPPPVQTIKFVAPAPRPAPKPKPTPLPTATPYLKARPSPTPAPLALAQVGVSNPPRTAASCAALACALAAASQSWPLMGLALLALLALVVAAWLLISRRRTQPAIATSAATATLAEAALAGGPLLPPSLPDDAEPRVVSVLEASQPISASAESPAAEPPTRIVPVLEADVATDAGDMVSE